MIIACTIPTEGCPILGFFAKAGSDAADAAFVRSAQTPLRMRSWYPPLRQAQGRLFAKGAKDGHPTVGDDSKIKSLGHPPINE